MTAREMIARTTIALFLFTGAASAQRASLAVGAATPVGNLSNTAGSGLDVDFQVRTEPMLGPLSLRLDLGYDLLPGKGAFASTALSAQSVSLVGDLGSAFYWIAGPGYYQATVKTQLSGHNVTEQRNYLGAQAALGVNVPLFRWEGFLELSGVKLFAPGPAIAYVPVRFGIRL